jgi:hypothetical protein
MFKSSGIESPILITLANGEIQQGCFIKADKRTMRRPKQETLQSVRGWFAVGTFRYFDKATMKAVVVGSPPFSGGNSIRNKTDKVSGTVFRTYTQGIPGLPRGNPESNLVDQYVGWMGENTRYGHNFIREARLFVDLFDLTHWQLIEAKVATDRETIRMAIGQLMDYRRYYTRPPSLAVLLGSRPSTGCLRLLTDNHITVIWRNSNGSFRIQKWQE